MEDQVELKRVFGDVYFRARRDQNTSIVYAHWYGSQAVETVKAGGYKFLEMIKEKPYRKLLNSNEHVIGSWDLALEWAQNEWAPQMRKAGLRYLAYVVPTTIYASMTMEMLIQRIDDEFEIRNKEADAEAWLLR
ncbi:hypothetical protein [Rufibacter tibetensis]|uniref:STAS/SEC14 domain-containing protein n=1 Tax=Rufibacter tibetensis TaxID=512763 RepID=A0A0P0CUK6_9BACT|nr:hypothetical protein [Rufibacter tibetensis]ALI98031.1 hypothetical protein DC20_02365 [Rufibacter tibetensis]